MAVKIRLKRLGRRKRPFFRVVAIDSRSRRDGAEIERLGWYDPLTTTGERFRLNEDRIFHWLEVGAQPSDTVKSLLSEAGIGLKWHLKRNGKNSEEIDAAVAEWKQQQLQLQRRKEALEAQEKRADEPQAEEAEEAPAAEAEAGAAAEPEAGAAVEESVSVETSSAEAATEAAQEDPAEEEAAVEPEAKAAAEEPAPEETSAGTAAAEEAVADEAAAEEKPEAAEEGETAEEAGAPQEEPVDKAAPDDKDRTAEEGHPEALKG